MTAMGAFYARGIGVAADPAAALGWYEKPAAADDPWGQLALAQLLLAGDLSGGEPDLAAAAAALEAAVAADIVPAKRPLGDLLLPLDPATGEIVPADPNRALSLYTEAAAAGDVWAGYHLAQIYAARRLGPVDLERAAGHYADAAAGGIGPAARAFGPTLRDRRGGSGRSGPRRRPLQHRRGRGRYRCRAGPHPARPPARATAEACARNPEADRTLPAG